MAAKPQKAKVTDLLRQKLNRAPIPDLGLVANEFIDRAGGPRNFGSLLWDEFTKAQAGSLARQRIIELVGKFIKGQEHRLSSDDLDRLDDAELHQLFLNAAERAGITNAELAAGPAAPGAETQGGGGPAGPEAAGEGGGGGGAAGGPGEGPAGPAGAG
jgi:hypothetical protein